jgi:hypothetical protein
MFYSRNVSERFAKLTTATESTKSVFHTDSRPHSFQPSLILWTYSQKFYHCPLSHNDPSPLDLATWSPPPERSCLRPVALPTGTTSRLRPVAVSEKVATHRPGEGNRPPPWRRPIDPATRPPPKHVPGCRRAGEPSLASLEHHLWTLPCQRPEVHLPDVACTSTRSSPLEDLLVIT